MPRPALWLCDALLYKLQFFTSGLKGMGDVHAGVVVVDDVSLKAVLRVSGIFLSPEN